jgi:ComF family protein
MAAEYAGLAKKLIRAYKFERVRAAYKPLAEATLAILPYFNDITIVHIPTAPTRIRQRGYDQSALLAREIASQRGWRHCYLLRRRHDFRQVGSTRAQRFAQAAHAFEIRGDAAGKHILLVDDVTTSGATLSAAAELLMAAGAARVDAVVVAKHTLE